MKQNIHTSIYKPLLYVLTIFTIAIIAFNSYIYYEKFIETKNKLHETILSETKNTMKSKVDFIVSEIEPTIKKERQKVKDDLVKKVHTAYNIAMHLYNLNKNNPKVIEIVKEALRELTFNDMGDQYVFITKLDGTFILTPGLRFLEGKNVFERQTQENKKSIQNIIKLVKEKEETFYTYNWQNHITLEFETKTSYFKYFEPFDAYIGTGVFEREIDENIQSKFLEQLESYKFGENMKNYFFSATYYGMGLTYPTKGRDVYYIKDMNGKMIVQELIKTAQDGGGFVDYHMPIGDNKSLYKLSYVAGVDMWDLYIGTGEIVANIDKQLEVKKDELLRDLYKEIIMTILFSVIFFIVFFIILQNLRNRLTKDIDTLNNNIENLVTKNQTTNNDSIDFEEFISIQQHIDELFEKKQKMELELKDKETMLIHQSKMAAMGEMMENIAHQWRQPLSVISTSSSSILLNQELGLLDDKAITKSMTNIMDSSEYLSQTIDDFRNFFEKDKIKENVSLENIIEKSLKLMHAKLKSSNISIETDIKEISISTYKNELIQVILVLLNNSKDALESQQIENKTIKISSTFDNNYVYINFCDNAKGINNEILDKIFDPYFTTKHKSKGTGIGLYMAAQIVSNHMNGELSVQNHQYKSNGKAETGALFTIKLPLNI